MSGAMRTIYLLIACLLVAFEAVTYWLPSQQAFVLTVKNTCPTHPCQRLIAYPIEYPKK